MRLRSIAPVVVLLLVGLPASSRGQGLFTGFIGRTSDVQVGADDCPIPAECELDGKFTWGLSAGKIGTFGYEVDFGLTKNFFGGEESEEVDSYLMTLTGNLLISVPIDRGGAGIRPYVVGGMGLVKTRVEGLSSIVDFSRNDLGMDLGFGAIGFLSPGFGIRGDMRYFRRLTKEDEGFGFEFGDISFWRLSVGASVRF
jgi:opacity protein-like surface antigen